MGKRYPYPIAVAPTGNHRLAHPDGELATSRAVASHGVTMGASTFSNASLENIIKAGMKVPRAEGIPEPNYWLQLYCFHRKEVAENLIRRAEKAGYKAVVLTVDLPYPGKRYNELRNGFSLPPHVRYGNFNLPPSVSISPENSAEQDLAMKTKSSGPSDNSEIPHVDSSLENKSGNAGLYFGLRFSCRGGDCHGGYPGPVRCISRHVLGSHHSMVEKSDLDENHRQSMGSPWTAKVLNKKGITTWEDAKAAAEYKVDAVWVSNHGGRQLDTSPSSLDALHEIVDVLRPSHPEIAILFDSGVMRGTDVFKAVAIGADLCFVGRAALWGLAYDGQKGVELALQLLADELKTTMGLAGVRKLTEIRRSHLGFVKPEGGIQSLEDRSARL